MLFCTQRTFSSLYVAHMQASKALTSRLCLRTRPILPARPRTSCLSTTPTDKMVSVQEYIEGHSLQSKVEQALNMCVKAKPEDPMSFMVRCTWHLLPRTIIGSPRATIGTSVSFDLVFLLAYIRCMANARQSRPHAAFGGCSGG